MSLFLLKPPHRSFSYASTKILDKPTVIGSSKHQNAVVSCCGLRIRLFLHSEFECLEVDGALEEFAKWLPPGGEQKSPERFNSSPLKNEARLEDLIPFLFWV